MTRQALQGGHDNVRQLDTVLHPQLLRRTRTRSYKTGHKNTLTLLWKTMMKPSAQGVSPFCCRLLGAKPYYPMVRSNESHRCLIITNSTPPDNYSIHRQRVQVLQRDTRGVRRAVNTYTFVCSAVGSAEEHMWLVRVLVCITSLESNRLSQILYHISGALNGPNARQFLRGKEVRLVSASKQNKPVTLKSRCSMAL